MIEPTRGRVYDPICGTGGFFVQSEKFIDAHQGQRDDVAIYGQERNHTTFRLARMNLATRGIFADIRWNPDGTLLRDEFPDGRFDYILAGPPFSISDWSGYLLREAHPWRFGAPPVGNANFVRIHHLYAHLSATGAVRCRSSTPARWARWSRKPQAKGTFGRGDPPHRHLPRVAGRGARGQLRRRARLLQVRLAGRFSPAQRVAIDEMIPLKTRRSSIRGRPWLLGKTGCRRTICSSVSQNRLLMCQVSSPAQHHAHNLKLMGPD